MTRKRYGMKSSCALCGQDIEWVGRKFGWTLGLH